MWAVLLDSQNKTNAYCPGRLSVSLPIPLNCPELNCVVLNLPNAVVVTPNNEVIFDLLHNCNFTTVGNCNANICLFQWSYATHAEGSFDHHPSPPPWTVTHGLILTDIEPRL